MALNASKVAGGNNENRIIQANLEPGNYPARVVQIIDYGLQPQRPYQGQDKPPAQEIGITYELLDEFMKDEEGDDLTDKPRWISETFPLRNLKADKAKSTLRYNALDPQGGLGGDFSQLLGTPCMVTVVNNTVGDKTYDNVGNVGPMRPRDAANAPELVNEAKMFDLDEPNMVVFNGFPQWIQDKIKGNLNFKGSALEKALGNPPPAAPKAEKAKPVKKDRKAAEPAEDPPFDADNPEAGADDGNNPY